DQFVVSVVEVLSARYPVTRNRDEVEPGSVRVHPSSAERAACTTGATANVVEPEHKKRCHVSVLVIGGVFAIYHAVRDHRDAGEQTFHFRDNRRLNCRDVEVVTHSDLRIAFSALEANSWYTSS